MDAKTFDHDAWRTVAGTGISYLLILVGMFVALFVVPYLVFSAVGVA